MKVNRCDVCGIYYDALPDECCIVISNIREKVYYDVREHDSLCKKLDLCPVCIRKIQEVIDERAKQKKVFKNIVYDPCEDEREHSLCE